MTTVQAVTAFELFTKERGETIVHISACELNGKILGTATTLKFVGEVEGIVIKNYEYTSFGMWLTKNTAWIDPAIVDTARTMFAENL